jgi:hypothetical protein
MDVLHGKLAGFGLIRMEHDALPVTNAKETPDESTSIQLRRTARDASPWRPASEPGGQRERYSKIASLLYNGNAQRNAMQDGAFPD